MREIRAIVIHCSATPNTATLFSGQPGKRGFKTPATTINEWHRARGFRRTATARKVQNESLDAIGYHFVIARNGALFSGRHIHETGAHVAGHNQYTLGICMVGMDSFTREQWETLRNCVTSLRNLPDLKGKPVRILGHRDLSPDKNGNGVVEPHEWLKTCPGFDVSAWVKGGMDPLPGHIWESA